MYAVPRLRKCISSAFIHLISVFGNNGGFEIVAKFLASQEVAEDQMNLNAIASLANLISYPYLIYHRDFIHTFGPIFV